MFRTRLKAGVVPRATARIVLVVAMGAVPLGDIRGDEAKVTVEVLKKTDIRLTTTQPGTVHAIATANLFPRVAGYVKSLQVDIGDTVKRGQVLAEIHAPELLAEREQRQAEVERASAFVIKAQAAIKVVEAAMGAARAQVDAAKAEAARAEATISFRQKEQQRLQGLSEKGAVESHVVAEAQDRFEAAQATRATAQAQLLTAQAAVAENQARRDAARADLMVAEAELKIAQARLRGREPRATRHHRRAPGRRRDPAQHARGGFCPAGRDGRRPSVDDRRDGQGARGRRGSRAGRAAPAPGSTGHGRDRRSAGPRLPGHDRAQAPAEDAATRTLRAEIELDNADGRLLPGLTAAVTIQLQERHDVLTVPASALIAQDADGSAACYRVVDGRAVRTRIKTGVEAGDRVEVCAGLNAGDRVVVHPGPEIADGQKIETAAPGDGRTENRHEVAPKDPVPAAPPGRALVQERAATARQIVEQDMQRLKAAMTLPGDDFPAWSRRWMEEQIRLHPAPAERIAAIQAHLARMKELEQILDGYAKTGQGRVVDALKMKYFRLEAEQMLAEGKAIVGDLPPVPSRKADEKGAVPSPRR